MTTLPRPISLPATTVARLGRLERAAAHLGAALLRWADSRAAQSLTHEERARHLATIDGIRSREHIALQHLLPR